MAKNKKNWHPEFVKYMDTIVNHENYKGLSIENKKNGKLCWIAPANSDIGQDRIKWCENKAKQLNLDIEPGVYAKVMLEIHPTKSKVCQTCGKSMSLYYHYPNANFLSNLNNKFNKNYTHCDHISYIWDDLIQNNIQSQEIAQYLINKGELNLQPTATKDEIINELELVCRTKGKKCLGPGAMSNFPDRFDGFHTYNRCCRTQHDKGRSKENLKSYTKDRRAYEYWSDGNIHAANQFMGSEYFQDTSADHIGPISLGFIHDPRYIQQMDIRSNSAKRDRLQIEDIEKIIEIENQTQICPVSCYSKIIWNHIKNNYDKNNIKKYNDILKQNMVNFMYILWFVMDSCQKKGEDVLVKIFLQPKFKYFKCTYKFSKVGAIIQESQRNITQKSKTEIQRYCNIAIKSVNEYKDKNNRKYTHNLVPDECNKLNKICNLINSNSSENCIRQNIVSLLETIQDRLIKNVL